MNKDSLEREVIVFLVHGYNGITKLFEYFKDTLSSKGFEVIMPIFPTQTDINQERFFAIFDKYRDKINENTILIAHSIGNIMAMKYLCKNNLKVKGYVSLAGFGESFIKEGYGDLNNVVKPLSLSDSELAKIPELTRRSYSIYSNDTICSV